MADGTLVLNQTLYGQQIRNVTTWSNIRVPEPELQELADAIRASFTGGASALMVDNWSLDSVTLIYNDEAPVFSDQVTFTAGPLVGSAGASETTTQSAALVSLQAAGAPPNRGRIYFGGVAGGSLTTTGLWQTTVSSTLATMVEIWAGGIATTSNIFYLRIGRRDAAGLIVASSAVTTVIGRSIPAVQRRRRIGQGI